MHIFTLLYIMFSLLSANVLLVQAEEKMRLLIAKNSKRLKLLDQKGTEPEKIDETRNLLRKLSTKIRIAVRVIAKISRKINKLRDEELWPQVNALIQGYAPLLPQVLICCCCYCQCYYCYCYITNTLTLNITITTTTNIIVIESFTQLIVSWYAFMQTEWIERKP
jgi:hypothetical protein